MESIHLSYKYLTLVDNTFMKKLTFSVQINASKDKVWDTLWNNKTFREWAGIIDPGTYMVGELNKGSQIQFISSENGYGVTSKVEKVDAGSYLLLRHQADTKDRGESERDDEWTGGTESYSLEELGGITTLTVIFDVPEELEGIFMDRYPKALQKVKELAQTTSA